MALRSTTAASTKLFGVDIAGEIGRALGPILQAATLTKYTTGSRTALSLAAGTNSTTTAITCRGFRDEKAEAGGRDVTVVLLGSTITNAGVRVVPEPGDTVTIQGETHAVTAVEHDPAAATYTCTCGGAGPGMR
jgi:hypothetical protein